MTASENGKKNETTAGKERSELTEDELKQAMEASRQLVHRETVQRALEIKTAIKIARAKTKKSRVIEWLTLIAILALLFTVFQLWIGNPPMW